MAIGYTVVVFPPLLEDAVFAVVAAILFAFALLFELLNTSLGSVVNATTLTTAGLLFVALHLAGAYSWGGRWRSRRRR